MKVISRLFLVFILLAAFNGHHQAFAKEAKQNQFIVVPMVNTKGKTVGQVKLFEKKDGVHLKIDVSGFKPGIHGIHFHEYGVCKPPDFKTAGKHFNPYGKEHGLENPKGPHAGDLPNVFADSHGHVGTELVTKLITLKKGKPNSIRDINGATIVINSEADDLKSNPTGNSGGRIACGVIKPN